MKTLIFATLAATLAASPIALSAAEAQGRYYDHRDDRGRHGFDRRDDRGGYRTWRRGERFDQRYARNYQVIDYRRYRGLRAPPRGYRYVRSGNDALLVGITSGIIASVVAGAIR